LVISSGEPAGIGPEICLRLAKQATQLPPLVILTDRRMLTARAHHLGLKVQLHAYTPGHPCINEANALNILHLPLATDCKPGYPESSNANYVLAQLQRSVTGCMQGEFSALVTAPVHKAIINQAGYQFSGHTEYLAELGSAAHPVMMLAGQVHNSANSNQESLIMRVALVTTHLPLAAVASSITTRRVESVLRILDSELRCKYGITAPRIMVAGLNPHAGEGGSLGREEIEIIIPTLDRLRQEGLQLLGPLPADTLFTSPQLAKTDAILSMYHDQGLAVFKYATFGRGVNITLGLPFIRTSVDHGTALDIAGKGFARPDSLIAAITEAHLMSKQNINKATKSKS